MQATHAGIKHTADCQHGKQQPHNTGKSSLRGFFIGGVPCGSVHNKTFQNSNINNCILKTRWITLKKTAEF